MPVQAGVAFAEGFRRLHLGATRLPFPVIRDRPSRDMPSTGSSSMWTWTPSSHRWRSSTIRRWPACRSSSGGRDSAASWPPAPTRPGCSGCIRPCRRTVARRLVRQAVFVDGRFHRYVEESRRAARHLRRPSRHWWKASRSMRPSSMCPVPAHCSGTDRPSPELIRSRVAERARPVLFGRRGPYKFVAKLASKQPSRWPTCTACGPGRGVVVVATGTRNSTSCIPFRSGPCGESDRLPVGDSTLSVSRTIGDLAALPPGALERHLGAALGIPSGCSGPGRRPRPVVPDQQAKSIGHEETFPTDLRDRAGARPAPGQRWSMPRPPTFRRRPVWRLGR